VPGEEFHDPQKDDRFPGLGLSKYVNAFGPRHDHPPGTLQIAKYKMQISGKNRYHSKICNLRFSCGVLKIFMLMSFQEQ
jgi:hypothetical protein